MKNNDVKEVKVVGHVQELVGNPSALGLLGLAMVTLVASSQKLGLTGGPTGSVAYVLPWAIFLGALAQFVAGLYDFKHNNTFGATAFCGYGFFWFGVAMTWMIKMGMFGQAVAATGDIRQLGFAFLGYFIFTVYMTIGSMGTNKVLFIIFFLIDLLFLGLFMSTLGWGGETWHKLAAWSELLISIFSFYGSAASVLNTHYNQAVLPVGKPFGPWVK
ncbi:MAG: acetate uptake transporter [Syntrophothermus sp.]|uniref:acetate uptake transporter n=1 Tax=Syntrophothermus sp. TaxID=2736299 RepID=UPI00257B9613|nr:acetate uptake transporter [Syntrophothermus sp.]NSW83536.1 acetate uptake transporter [Syntrophothermus sp.]